MLRFLEFLAVPMPVIKAYSFQHLLVAAVTLTAAFCLAKHFGFTKLLGGKSRARVLFSCGLLLAFMEIIKQLLLTYVRGGRYSWSDFPFQLCSVPMYLCLIYPFWKKGRRAIGNFLMTFGLLGSIAAFVIPYSSFTDYLVLTAQSVLWHGTLFFLAAYMMLSEFSGSAWNSGNSKKTAWNSGNSEKTAWNSESAFLKAGIRQLIHDFRGAALLYLVCAVIAVAANISFYQISGGTANMFFFGPGWPDMIVLDDIYGKAGWIPETLIMAAGTEAAAFVIYFLLHFLHKRIDKSGN